MYVGALSVQLFLLLTVQKRQCHEPEGKDKPGKYLAGEALLAHAMDQKCQEKQTETWQHYARQPKKEYGRIFDRKPLRVQIILFGNLIRNFHQVNFRLPVIFSEAPIITGTSGVDEEQSGLNDE